jgi:hypothetical protein
MWVDALACCPCLAAVSAFVPSLRSLRAVGLQLSATSRVAVPRAASAAVRALPVARVASRTMSSAHGPPDPWPYTEPYRKSATHTQGATKDSSRRRNREEQSKHATSHCECIWTTGAYLWRPRGQSFRLSLGVQAASPLSSGGQCGLLQADRSVPLCVRVAGANALLSSVPLLFASPSPPSRASSLRSPPRAVLSCVVCALCASGVTMATDWRSSVCP